MNESMPTQITEVDFATHYLAKTSSNIKELIKPLHKFGITMFDFCRIYEDNSNLDLTTVPEFCELFAKNHLYRYGCGGHFDEYQEGYFFWDTLTSTEVFKALEQQYRLKN